MPRYKLPPYTVKEVLVSKDVQDQPDWGQSDLPETWKKCTGKGVKVAILDTGIDKLHMQSGDLQSSVVAGANFTDEGGTSDFYDKPYDGHGTHCAGIVGGRFQGGPVVGWAPESELLIGKVLNRGSGDFSWIAEGVRWATKMKADVISMSLGASSRSSSIMEAIEEAISQGIFVICAAGNDGTPDSVNYPARHRPTQRRPNLDTLAVASYNQEGRLSRFSSRGEEVDIAGPGSDILSTYLKGGYAKLSGTSMATPAVAGLTALLIQRHRDLGGGNTPLKTMDDLRSHLLEGSDPTKGVGNKYPMIDVDEMMEHEADLPPEKVEDLKPLITIPLNGKSIKLYAEVVDTE